MYRNVDPADALLDGIQQHTTTLIILIIIVQINNRQIGILVNVIPWTCFFFQNVIARLALQNWRKVLFQK